VEQRIAFTARSAEPLPEVDLGPLVCALEADPRLTLAIGVHSDSLGSESYNLRLSQDRADALRGALVAAGIAPERITAWGYGESQPIAPNTTE